MLADIVCGGIEHFIPIIQILLLEVNKTNTRLFVSIPNRRLLGITRKYWLNNKTPPLRGVLC